MIGGSAAVLLDTCAVIFLANGEPIAPRATEAIMAAGRQRAILVSVASAIEIGRLAHIRPARTELQFLPDARAWYDRFLTGPGIRETPITSAIAIDASRLPGAIHGDPMDRLIVTTARHLGIPVVTRDRRILEYARSGEVMAIPC